MRPQSNDIEAVIREALSKYDKGRLEHGQIDLSTDKRDLIHEAEQELLDCINLLRISGIEIKRYQVKAELTLPSELVKEIAKEVIELLKPMLSGNGKHEVEDTIFDVHGLSECLKVSKQWIYERTHLKEIPHLKIDGQLRFRKRDIDKWLNSYNVPAISTPKRILKAVT